MARTTTSIQAEITTIEAYLQSTASLLASVNSVGTGLTRAQRNQLEERLSDLYIQLDRATGDAPMFVRGVVTGLR